MNCPYEGKCSKEGDMCDSCACNKKQDYYVRDLGCKQPVKEVGVDKLRIIPCEIEGDNKYSNDAYWKPPWDLT